MIVHPQFDPVAIHLGPLAIHWYGLMYLLGFGLFLLLGNYRIRQGHAFLTSKLLDDLLMYGVLGVVIGGRLGEVLFYEPGYYFSHPAEIFMVWKGGMSFHGGFLGVLVGMALFARKQQRSFWELTDFIARWCRWAWPPGVSATSSMASCGAAWPARICPGPCCFLPPEPMIWSRARPRPTC
jgi:phosphatidylglycerol:prolipoprotein diacylglycerol transferase